MPEAAQKAALERNRMDQSLKNAVLNFQPMPLRQVVVWYHGTSEGRPIHQVGFADYVDGHDNDLEISFKWVISLDHIGGTNGRRWKALPESKQTGERKTFPQCSVVSVTEDGAEFRHGNEVVRLYVDGSHLIEAQEILDRYK